MTCLKRENNIFSAALEVLFSKNANEGSNPSLSVDILRQIIDWGIVGVRGCCPHRRGDAPALRKLKLVNHRPER